MGASVALFLARAGMRVALIDRGGICRSASGANAGTLTLHMTRAALIPYAMRGFEMWADASAWLGHDLGVTRTEGLCCAFTEDEVALLEERTRVRAAAGAPMELVSPARACAIEPGLGEAVRLAAFCPIDGFASAYLTGLAYRQALWRSACRCWSIARLAGWSRQARAFACAVRASMSGRRGWCSPAAYGSSRCCAGSASTCR
jgi:sarcosine oxidase, subunit beta